MSGIELQEESNRVSCRSRDGNGWMGMVAAILWPRELRIRRRSHVVVTGTRKLGDLLDEGERSQRQSLDCVQMNK